MTKREDTSYILSMMSIKKDCSTGNIVWQFQVAAIFHFNIENKIIILPIMSRPGLCLGQFTNYNPFDPRKLKSKRIITELPA